MPKIFVLSGPDVGMSFEVQAGATFGRAPECTVPLRHASVSRQHAELELAGGAWTVVDLRSRNGLTVSGQRLPRARLEDGDEFQLGEVVLRFRLPGVSSSTAVEPEPRAATKTAPPPASGEDIVLEGDWDPLATPAPASMGGAAPADPLAGTVFTAPTARERATAKLAAAGALPKGTASRGILQYNKVEARPGFLRAELGQQPWWIQAGVAVLLLVVFALLAWLVFRGTVWLRGGPGAAPVVEEEAGEDR